MTPRCSYAEAGVSSASSMSAMRGWGGGVGRRRISSSLRAATVLGWSGPAVLDGLDDEEVQVGKHGGIEVGLGELDDAVDLDRGPVALVGLDLVGDEDELLERRHAGVGGGVVGDGAEDVGIDHLVLLAEDGDGERAVEEDRLETVDGVGGVALLAGDVQEALVAVGAHEVVAERGDGDGVAVDAVDLGEVARLRDDAHDVLGEAGGNLEERRAEELFDVVHRRLLGNRLTKSSTRQERTFTRMRRCVLTRSRMGAR